MEETYESISMKKEYEGGEVNSKKWNMMIEEVEDSVSESTTDDSSSMAAASSSCCLSTDSEVEDASSSSSLSSSSANNGPLFHLTDLMNQLPIRRGLSKHYKGKSQSFTSMAHVKNLEDLAKKVSPYAIISSYDRRRRRMKSCKSYATFDHAHTKYGA